MSDFDKLAQRIVALGFADLLTLPEPHHGRAYQFPAGREIGTLFLSAEVFCNDGRVVLALMEKCSHIDAYWDDTGWSCHVVGTFAQRGIGEHDGMVQRSPLAIAICEACVEALEKANDE